MIGPDAPDEEKGRHLRALYRQHKPGVTWRGGKMIVDQAGQAEQWRMVKAEYGRLYGDAGSGHDLSRILTSAWTEERELAGQRYDYNRQAWFNADGSRADR